MVLLFWLGLAISFIGLALVSLFGLIWIQDTGLHVWGFRIGIALMIVGVSILSVAN